MREAQVQLAIERRVERRGMTADKKERRRINRLIR